MKKPVLLLHGALGAVGQFKELSGLLADKWQPFTLNFSGHGQSAMPEGPFSIPLFADEVLDFLDENDLGRVDIFGYSMGGYVGLYLALHQTGRVGKLITLGTKLEWTEEGAIKEVAMLNPHTLVKKVPKFANLLAERHGPGWKQTCMKTAEMMLNLGSQDALAHSDFEKIRHKVLLMVGDRDPMVSIAETRAVQQLMENSLLGVLPGTGHPLEKADTRALAFFIGHFLGGSY